MTVDRRDGPSPDDGFRHRIGDWDFLIGRWTVRHRKLRARLAGNRDWDDFDGTCVDWTVLGGAEYGRQSAPAPGGAIALHEGRPITLRFQWSRITATSAFWEQAYSADGGANWETNWTMAFTRA